MQDVGRDSWRDSAVRSETSTASPVAGGAAYIGSRLAEALLACGCPLIVPDNLSTGVLSNLEPVAGLPGPSFVQESVLDKLGVDELNHQCDTVIHPAGGRWGETRYGATVAVADSQYSRLRGCQRDGDPQ